MKYLVLAMLTFSLSAQAQEHPGHGQYHADFYSKWVTKDGNSCCNTSDCSPIDDKNVRIGKDVEVNINGEWLTVPPEKIRPYMAPDMSSHLCHIGTNVYCFVFGGGV